MNMKFIREVQNNEIIITNKKNETVKIIQTSYLNVGKNVSLYGNRDTDFREYAQMIFEGNKYFDTWPRVADIDYVEESDCLLFKDYIEIFDEYTEKDKPFITEIYFYVDFNGVILTDAYSPMLNKYFPLPVDKEIPRCPWLDKKLSVRDQFYRRYREVKEDIGWQIIFLLERRKNNQIKKLLNRKWEKYENTKC